MSYRLAMRLPDIFRRNPIAETARQIYVSIVHQSRLPSFFTAAEVPDTLDGRFELIVLHAFLVMRRLKTEGVAERELSQAIFDIMFADMDQNLREMGVGDLGVGRRVKAMAAAFYGRLAAYEAGLESNDADLAAALRRNLYGTVEPGEGALTAMLDYIRLAGAESKNWPLSDLQRGQIRFPDAPLDRASASAKIH